MTKELRSARLPSPHTWTTGHREIDLEPTVNFLPAGKLSRCRKGLEKLLEEKTRQLSYSELDPVCRSSNLPGKICPICNSGMTVVGVTNHFLIGYEACSTERAHAWYYKPDQKPKAREVTEPKGEAASVILLNGHVFKESLTYICLHPHTWAVLSLGQRGFFLQWAAVNREIHNWSQY